MGHGIREKCAGEEPSHVDIPFHVSSHSTVPPLFPRDEHQAPVTSRNASIPARRPHHKTKSAQFGKHEPRLDNQQAVTFPTSSISAVHVRNVIMSRISRFFRSSTRTITAHDRPERQLRYDM